MLTGTVPAPSSLRLDIAATYVMTMKKNQGTYNLQYYKTIRHVLKSSFKISTHFQIFCIARQRVEKYIGAPFFLFIPHL